jgi:hypothetical protein
MYEESREKQDIRLMIMEINPFGFFSRSLDFIEKLWFSR